MGRHPYVDLNGGNAAPRRKTGLTQQAPDPLDNLFLVMPKAYDLALKISSSPEIIPNNCHRGWQALDFLSEFEQNFSRVSLETYLKVHG